MKLVGVAQCFGSNHFLAMRSVSADGRMICRELCCALSGSTVSKCEVKWRLLVCGGRRILQMVEWEDEECVGRGLE